MNYFCQKYFGLGVCLGAVLFVNDAAHGQVYTVGDGDAITVISSTGSLSTISTPDFTPSTIATEGSDIYIANEPYLTQSDSSPVIQEYTTSGQEVSSSLVSNIPTAGSFAYYNGVYLGVSGSDLFVVSGNQIGEYTTTGTPVNTDLVNLPVATGNSFVTGFAVSGTTLFVSTSSNLPQENGPYLQEGTVTAYNAATGSEIGGAPILSGLDYPGQIVTYGSDFFLADVSGVQEYTLNGTAVKSVLYQPNLDNQSPLGVTGNDLYITTSPGSLSEYTTDGAFVRSFSNLSVSYTNGLAVANQVVLTPVAPATKTSTVTESASGQYNTSTIQPVTSSGGLGTTATILAGQATGSLTTPRTVQISTTTTGSSFSSLASDVVSISGNAGDIFAPQLTFNLTAANDNGGPSNMTLLWLNPQTGKWVNAVDGNTDIEGVTDATGGELDFQGSFSLFQQQYGTNLSLYLGAYGVDTTSDTVWAVIDHNSNFGAGNLSDPPQPVATPEPTTWALLLGGLGLLLTFTRRRAASSASAENAAARPRA